MEILAGRIKRKLETQSGKLWHCAIYEDELQRVWPLDRENREKLIAQFATDYGFHLAFYREGLCAVSVKNPPNVSV